MTVAKPNAETYLNGPNKIGPNIRVIKDGATIRPASSTELENGVTSRTVLPDSPASVRTNYAQGKYLYCASGAIAEGDEVFRANGGKVSNSGTSSIGTADEAAVDGASFFVNFGIVPSTGGGGGPAPDTGPPGDPAAETSSRTFDSNYGYEYVEFDISGGSLVATLDDVRKLRIKTIGDVSKNYTLTVVTLAGPVTLRTMVPNQTFEFVLTDATAKTYKWFN